VDGGGTKTSTSCVDVSTQKVLSNVLTGSSNWNSVGKSIAKESICRGIEQALQDAGASKNQVKGIGLGMAGVDREEDIDTVTGWINEVLPGLDNISVTNDAIAALASGTRGDLFGIVAISGTGNIVYGFNKDGNEKRSSGWGPLLGDEGSGYAVASLMLKAITFALDGKGPPTTLQDAVFKRLGINKPEQLIPWAYDDKNSSWTKIADLAPLVSQCARDGDQVANQILDYTADQILLSIIAVAKGLGFSESTEFPLVLAGGTFTSESSLLKPILMKKMESKYPHCKATLPVVDIAVAGALLVLRRIQ